MSDPVTSRKALVVIMKSQADKIMDLMMLLPTHAIGCIRKDFAKKGEKSGLNLAEFVSIMTKHMLTEVRHGV
jgi:hypothetical protein